MRQFLIYGLCVLGGFGIGLTSARMARSTYILTETETTPVVVSSQPPVLTPLLAQDKPNESVRIMVVGDIMLGRSVMGAMRAKNDFVWPLRNVVNELKSADLTLANLESPFMDDCPPSDSGYVFCADPRSVTALTEAGIDSVGLANNHMYNYQQSGIETTKRVLSQAGIAYAGLGDPVYTSVRGVRIAFLNFNDVGKYTGIAQANEQALREGIAAMRDQAQIVIVMFHWGEEYRQTPTVRQQTLAHLAIDTGADIVVGAHPHWVQTHEIYLGKPIYYSLGNFVFDQSWSEETKKGIAVEFTVRGKDVQANELPVYIYHNGQPAWVSQ